MVRANRRLGYYVFILIFLMSCADSAILHEKKTDIPGNGWSRDALITDSWEIPEAVMNSKIQIRVHVSPEFGYQNLYLMGHARVNGEAVWADTFSIQLMDGSRGGWLGQKSGDGWVVTHMVSEIPTLEEGDEVSYDISQFSREERLQGIRWLKVRFIEVE